MAAVYNLGTGKMRCKGALIETIGAPPRGARDGRRLTELPLASWRAGQDHGGRATNFPVEYVSGGRSSSRR